MIVVYINLKFLHLRIFLQVRILEFNWIGLKDNLCNRLGMLIFLIFVLRFYERERSYSLRFPSIRLCNGIWRYWISRWRIFRLLWKSRQNRWRIWFISLVVKLVSIIRYVSIVIYVRSWLVWYLVKLSWLTRRIYWCWDKLGIIKHLRN